VPACCRTRSSPRSAPRSTTDSFGSTRFGYSGRMHWIWLIIVGAIVGALGRLFHPGPDPMGWIVTIVLGIVSLIIGGLIAGGFWGFVIGVVIAVILTALYGRFAATRTARTV
jgi:uncharacterized membrane protein YeaQ/YmgE (transglycosylase-associated protein family)